MGYYNFPHTINYDSDLGWLICRVKELTHTVEDWKRISSIKFANPIEWNVQSNYEPFNVVLGPDGNSYLSLKYVPPGVSYDNTEFWERVANSDAQIENILTEVEKISTEVENINNKLINRKFVFLGDSYNFYSGGWLNSLVKNVGLTSGNYYDYIYSGHGFTVPNGKWLEDITKFVNENPTVLGEITDILIAGGLNDSTTDGLLILENEISNFMEYVKTNLPNARVMVAFIGSALSNASQLRGRNATNRVNAMRKYTTALSNHGGIYLHGCENAMCQYTFFQPDGIHPNEFGQEFIINALTQAINNGNASLYVTGSVAAQDFSSGQAATREAGDTIIINGTTEFTMNSLTLNSQQYGGLTLQNGLFSNFGRHWQMPMFNTEPIDVIGDVRPRDGSPSYNCSLTLKVVDGELLVRLNDTINQSQYKSIAETPIIIPSVTFKIPTAVSM